MRTRIHAPAAFMALSLACSSTAWAQQKTLVIAGYGGSFEQTMREDVIPAFAKQHDVRVDYVAGNSTDTVAKLQAQKSNQQIDVAIVDDGPMYQAVSLGFCGKLEGLDSSKLVKAAQFKDDKAVGLGIVATGLMYNKKVFAEKGWAAPTSWNDLKDPKFRKQVVVPPLNNTYGLHTLVMFARMNGGGEAKIDPGFAAIKADVGPNVVAYEPSPAKMTELFQTGQAVLAVWGSARVQSFAETGFPVDFVYPKEGAATLLVTACPIAKPDASPLAQEFIKLMLSPRVQKIMAEKYGYAPVAPGVEIEPAKSGMMPIGDRAKQLVNVDWDAINTVRDDWNKRWTREVER